MKRKEKGSLSEIAQQNNIGSPMLKDQKSEKGQYPGQKKRLTLDQSEDTFNESQDIADLEKSPTENQSATLELQQKLETQRKNFINFINMIGDDKNELVDLTELKQEMKVKFECIPHIKDLLLIYDKDIQKMLTNKSAKKNWNEDDTQILIWSALKYCKYKKISYHDLEEDDWKVIAELIPGKTLESCKFKWLQMQKTSIQIIPWTKEENALLTQLVKERGKKAWQDISKELYMRNDQKTYRSSKQCREHYNNHLDPTVRRGTWSKKEDLELLRLAREIGKKWSEIARLLNGRTENAVKNRYHAIFRKELERQDLFANMQMESDNNNNNDDYEDESTSNQNDDGKIQHPEPCLKPENMLINKLIFKLEKQLNINNPPQDEGETDMQEKVNIMNQIYKQQQEQQKKQNQISQMIKNEVIDEREEIKEFNLIETTKQQISSTKSMPTQSQVEISQKGSQVNVIHSAHSAITQDSIKGSSNSNILFYDKQSSSAAIPVLNQQAPQISQPTHQVWPIDNLQKQQQQQQQQMSLQQLPQIPSYPQLPYGMIYNQYNQQQQQQYYQQQQMPPNHQMPQYYMPYATSMQNIQQPQPQTFHYKMKKLSQYNQQQQSTRKRQCSIEDDILGQQQEDPLNSNQPQIVQQMKTSKSIQQSSLQSIESEAQPEAKFKIKTIQEFTNDDPCNCFYSIINTKKLEIYLIPPNLQYLQQQQTQQQQQQQQQQQIQQHQHQQNPAYVPPPQIQQQMYMNMNPQMHNQYNYCYQPPHSVPRSFSSMLQSPQITQQTLLGQLKTSNEDLMKPSEFKLGNGIFADKKNEFYQQSYNQIDQQISSEDQFGMYKYQDTLLQKNIQNQQQDSVITLPSLQSQSNMKDNCAQFQQQDCIVKEENVTQQIQGEKDRSHYYNQKIEISQLQQ